jgi:V8-like Glu-specific endopeptidase
VRNTSSAQWIGRSVAVVATFFAATGCTADSEGNSDVSANVRVDTETRIFGGQGDTDTTSLTGVVALKIGRGGKFELCSGALVAPNVVLTARHCVATSITSSVSCDENGHSTNGPHVGDDLPVGDVTVYTGTAPKFAEAPDSVAKAIVSPKGDSLCDSDIALVVLEQPIAKVEPLAVRLGAGVAAGETIRSIGYGQNDQQMPIGTRLRRDGVPVLAMGAGISHSRTALGAHEFEVGESICEGDSGGPAINEATGAIVGLVSRGGNCSDPAGHIYTTTAGFAPLFDQAFAIAGGAPVVETGSTPAEATESTGVEPAGKASDESGHSCAISHRAGAGAAGTRSGSTIAVLAAAAILLRRRTSRGARGSRPEK